LKSFEYTITDPLGIHARPAGLLVAFVKKDCAPSECTITKNGQTVKATQLMKLMGLGIKQGDTITVTVEGGDEDAASAKLESFLKANL